MSSLNFPDVNVWLALLVPSHTQSKQAIEWFEGSAHEQFCFCRFTQLGLLRLLTRPVVMQNRVLTMGGAWRVWLRCMEDDRIQFLNEPEGIDAEFRRQTGTHQASPKLWADGYLIAFAVCAELTIVTFDKAFRGRKAPCLVL